MDGWIAFIHSFIHWIVVCACVQLLRVVMMCAKRGERNGTLRRITPYLWIMMFRTFSIAGFARPHE